MIDNLYDQMDDSFDYSQEYDDINPKIKTCRNCGKSNLKWQKYEGRWRLVNYDSNFPHSCHTKIQEKKFEQPENQLKFVIYLREQARLSWHNIRFEILNGTGINRSDTYWKNLYQNHKEKDDKEKLELRCFSCDNKWRANEMESCPNCNNSNILIL